MPFIPDEPIVASNGFVPDEETPVKTPVGGFIPDPEPSQTKSAFVADEEIQSTWLGPQTKKPIEEIDGSKQYLEVMADQTPPGFWQNITDVTSKDIPFTGDFTSAAEIAKIAWIGRKIMTKQPVSDPDLVKFNTYMAIQKKQGNATWLGKAGTTIRESVTFGAEIGLIAGTGILSGGTTAVGGIGAKFMGKAGTIAARKAVEDVTTKLMMKTFGATMGKTAGKIAVDVGRASSDGLLLTILRPGAIEKGIEERKLGKMLSGKETQDPAMMSIMDQLIENTSEMSGEIIGNTVGGVIGKIPGATALKDSIKNKLITGTIFNGIASKFNVTRFKDVANVMKDLGYHGIVNEMWEERAGDFARGLLGVDGKAGLVEALQRAIPSIEQMKIESVAFAVPGIVHTALGFTGINGVNPLQFQRNLDIVKKATQHVQTEEEWETNRKALVDQVEAERKDPWNRGFKWMDFMFGQNRQGTAEDIYARTIQVEGAKLYEDAPKGKGKEAVDNLLRNRTVGIRIVPTEADKKGLSKLIEENKVVGLHHADQNDFNYYLTDTKTLDEKDVQKLADNTGIGLFIDINQADDSAVVKLRPHQVEKVEDVKRLFGTRDDDDANNMRGLLGTTLKDPDMAERINYGMPVIFKGTRAQYAEIGYGLNDDTKPFKTDSKDPKNNIYAMHKNAVTFGGEITLNKFTQTADLREDLLHHYTIEGNNGSHEVTGPAERWMIQARTKLEKQRQETKDPLVKARINSLLQFSDFEFVQKAYLYGVLGETARNSTNMAFMNLDELGITPDQSVDDYFLGLNKKIDLLRIKPKSSLGKLRERAEIAWQDKAKTDRQLALDHAKREALMEDLHDALKKESPREIDAVLRDIKSSGIQFSLTQTELIRQIHQMWEKIHGNVNALGDDDKKEMRKLLKKYSESLRASDIGGKEIRTEEGGSLRSDRSQVYPTLESFDRVITDDEALDLIPKYLMDMMPRTMTEFSQNFFDSKLDEIASAGIKEAESRKAKRIPSHESLVKQLERTRNRASSSYHRMVKGEYTIPIKDKDVPAIRSIPPGPAVKFPGQAAEATMEEKANETEIEKKNRRAGNYPAETENRFEGLTQKIIVPRETSTLQKLDPEQPIAPQITKFFTYGGKTVVDVAQHIDGLTAPIIDLSKSIFDPTILDVSDRYKEENDKLHLAFTSETDRKEQVDVAFAIYDPVMDERRSLAMQRLVQLARTGHLVRAPVGIEYDREGNVKSVNLDAIRSGLVEPTTTMGWKDGAHSVAVMVIPVQRLMAPREELITLAQEVHDFALNNGGKRIALAMEDYFERGRPVSAPYLPALREVLARGFGRDRVGFNAEAMQVAPELRKAHAEFKAKEAKLKADQAAERIKLEKERAELMAKWSETPAVSFGGVEEYNPMSPEWQDSVARQAAIAPIPARTEVTPVMETSKPTASRKRATGQISFDRPTLIQKFNDKAWTKPTVKGVKALAPDAIKSLDQWFRFVALHEAFHGLQPQRGGELKSDYENRANAYALQYSVLPTITWSPVARDAYNQLTQQPDTTLNVWYGSDQNADLSNLASRPFVYLVDMNIPGVFNNPEPVNFLSVEHAYQSLKSGEFDEETYNKYKTAGVKIQGKPALTKNDYNLKLMRNLMKESFEQNPEAKMRLLSTGDKKITHVRDKGIWAKEFPRLLTEIRTVLRRDDELRRNTIREGLEDKYGPPGQRFAEMQPLELPSQEESRSLDNFEFSLTSAELKSLPSRVLDLMAYANNKANRNYLPAGDLENYRRRVNMALAGDMAAMEFINTMLKPQRISGTPAADTIDKLWAQHVRARDLLAPIPEPGYETDANDFKDVANYSLVLTETLMEISPWLYAGSAGMHQQYLKNLRNMRAHIDNDMMQYHRWHKELGLTPDSPYFKRMSNAQTKLAERLLEAIGAQLESSDEVLREKGDLNAAYRLHLHLQNLRKRYNELQAQASELSKQGKRKEAAELARQADVIQLQISNLPISLWRPGDETHEAAESESADEIMRSWNTYKFKEQWTAEGLLAAIKQAYAKNRRIANEEVSMLTQSEWIRELHDYINHQYRKSVAMSDAEYLESVRTFVEETARSKTRRYPTYAEAAKHGLMPITQNAASLFKMWGQKVWSTQMRKIFLATAVNIRDADGMPTVIAVGKPAAEGDMIIDKRTLSEGAAILKNFVDEFNASLPKDRQEEKLTLDKNGELDVTAMKKHGYVAFDSPFNSIEKFWVKDGDSLNVMKMLLERKAEWRPFGGRDWLKGLEAFNAWTKSSLLFLSAFHPFSLIENYLSAEGLTLDSSLLHPRKAWAAYKAMYNRFRNDEQFVGDWIKHGLVIGHVDPNIAQGIVDRQIQAGLDRLKETDSPFARPANVVFGIKKYWDRWLWDELHPTLKLMTIDRIYNELKTQALANGTEFNEDIVKNEIASLANKSLGGLEFEKYIWATPKARQLLHGLMFAPDWTFAAAETAGITQLPLLKQIIRSDLSKTEFDVLAKKYWPAMASIFLIGIPNAIQAVIYAAFGNPDDGDRLFTFMNEQGKQTHIDVTPLVRRMRDIPIVGYEGGDTGKRRVYFRWGKQAYEIGGWFTEPITTAMNKSSMAVHTAWEQVTGTTTSGYPEEFKDQGMLGLFSAQGEFLKGRIGTVVSKVIPMNILSMIQDKPAGWFATASRGKTLGAVIQDMSEILEAYADHGTAAKLKGLPNYTKRMDTLIGDVIQSGIVNGVDVNEAYKRAQNGVATKYYTIFFKALNKNDKRAMEEAAEAILRLNKGQMNIIKSMASRLKVSGKPITAEQFQQIREITAQAQENINEEETR